MWSESVIGIPDDIVEGHVAVHCWVKHFKHPSKYGINKGRISKLMMKIGEEVVCNYDRGWDIRPTCKAAEVALNIIIFNYDGRNKYEEFYERGIEH